MTGKFIGMICLVFMLVSLCGCDSRLLNPGELAAKDAGSNGTIIKGEEGTAKGSPKPVTITLGIWPEDSKESEKRAYEEYKRICESKYPYITIKNEPYYYSPETFVIKAESGQLPTVFNTWFTEPQKIIDNGYAADITNIMEKYNYDREMNPEILKLLSRNGRIYGVPRDGYALGLYINMNLFRQAGLVDENGLPKYPKTFDELVETAKIIKQKTGKAGMFIPTKDYVGGWHFTQLAWAFGVEFEKKVDGRWMANFNTPEAVQALQYVKDLKWKHDVLLSEPLLSWGDWIRSYGTNQVGMVFASPDVIDAPINEYKMNKDAIAMAPIPAGPKGQYSLMGGTAYMFSANSTQEQVDAVFKFFEVAGITVGGNEESLTGLEIKLKKRAENGVVVGPKPMQVWNNKERISAEDAVYKKYTNVNMELFMPYYQTAFSNLRNEEPYYTQNLYAILDTVIQTVITDRSSDPKALLEKANNEFQAKLMNLVK